MIGYLFSYGTLQPGRAPAEIAPLVAKLRALGEGAVRGVLYDLGDYPGTLLDSSAEGTIAGSVLELPEDESILAELDEYEGFDPGAPGQSLFVRVPHPVTLASGGTLVCWIYVYNRETAGVRVLNSGCCQ
jgi:gamma-glutamylcyclotransferase (GGCT)/AIG2-like uncharacterized protein YtfP